MPLFAAVSCIETLDFEPNFESKVVVNCVLTADSVQTLSITRNRLPGQSTRYFEGIENAVAHLLCDDIEVGTFIHTVQGRYELAYTPEPGKTYGLEIQVPGEDSISASTVFPTRIHIFRTANGDDGRREFFQFTSGDPYWCFSFFLQERYVFNPPPEDAPKRLNERIGTDHPRADGFNAGHTAPLEWSVSVPEHLCYLRIEPRIEDGPVLFSIESDLPTFASSVVFRFVSSDYDAYLKSALQKAYVFRTFYDPSAYFNDDEIYSNIEGGLGIFGAYVDETYFMSFI